MPMSKEERIQRIRSLQNLGAGQAESIEIPLVRAAFYPVPEHLRALEPQGVLIVGDRGAGKTMLKRVATDRELREALFRHAPRLRAPSGTTEWVDAYPLHADGPDAAGWQRFATQHDNRPTVLQELWFAYLARVVERWLDPDARATLEGLLTSPGGDPERCYTAFQRAGVHVLLALDNLDKTLMERDQWLFVAYDELDTILFADWQAMGAIIRGLISFWAGHSRRWQRIRAKIFLRSDFYRHHSDVTGSDIAKLAASRVDISWSDKNLYAGLIKHIANRTPELFEYCRRPVAFEPEDPVLGHVPRLLRAEDARPFVDRLVGKYMGADAKKGRSFNWILDHVRDGNGNASPRSLVLLVEQAALLEGQSPRARGAHLLDPVSLRNALDRVSEQHVSQSRNEFPWLAGLQERLAEHRKVPWQRRELESALRARWDESWGHGSESQIRPPAQSARELVDYLVELGIMRDRGRNLFDAPDLFLAGLGLTRRGGVRRQ